MRDRSYPAVDHLPTSRDVARLAGVSQSSVCRVFDPKWAQRISPALRSRVLAAAQELDYQPNAIARCLTAQRSGIVGVVVSEYFNEFYYDIMRRITNDLQELGLRVMLFNAAPFSDIGEVLSKLVEYRVDGIIVTAAAVARQTDPIPPTSTPLVLVNIYAKEPFCSSVVCDNYSGSRQMAHYLYDCGCRRFAYFSAANSPYFDIPDRRRGFLDGLSERGCTDCQVVDGDYTYETGKRLGLEVLSTPDRPDCIFTTSSRMAYGIMDAARLSLGLSIPQDLSVATYDDTFASSLDSYQLTSIRQPSEELASTAVRLLIRAMDGKDRSIQTVYAQPTLTIRGSVCQPPSPY